jgi:hypothetical protein
MCKHISLILQNILIQLRSQREMKLGTITGCGLKHPTQAQVTMLPDGSKV